MPNIRAMVPPDTPGMSSTIPMVIPCKIIERLDLDMQFTS